MKLSTRILLAFAVVIILSVADSFTHYRLSLKVEKNIQFLSKSEAVIRNSNKIQKSILEMQSAFRGYLLSEDSAFLQPYFAGINGLPSLVSEQRNLVSDNPSQVRILDSIKSMHKEWVDYANSLIQAKQIMSAESQVLFKSLFENRFKKEVGKKINDQIGEKFQSFNKSEYAIRNLHARELISSINRTYNISFIFISLTIIIGLLSTIYIISIISKRIKSMVLLAENISKGKFYSVADDKKDELSGLSQSLNIMSDTLSKNIQELEKRNAELDKFAYVVSHDLKAPVRGIHNVIKWIEEDLGDELSIEMKKYLKIIPQRTQRMEALINGLLDYARVSHRMVPVQVDLIKLVNEIVDETVPREFEVTVTNLPKQLYAEPIKLEQVFTNLISNAVRYTAQENGRIEVGCIEFPNFYQFSIKDNGIGIHPDYHKKVFEIFQTLREKNEAESTGVGLAIVKKIIDEQDGIIKLNSTPGKGTEVIFTWRKN